MLFSDHERCHYARTPLAEVICQLRFPAILSINVGEPADYQESIRQDFPRYLARQEVPPAAIPGGGPNARAEPAPNVVNHHFVSTDGHWKINMTRDFIALSTLRYQGWEDFASRLDKPLAQFIQLYKPAFLQRIGLRYINAISRNALGLQDFLWDDLIMPHYLGVLGEPDVDETMVPSSTLDTELTLPDDCRAKLHAGPGLLNGGKADQEVKFILDFDLSRTGNLSADQVPGILDTLHQNADRLFLGAITQALHSALLPAEGGA